MMFFGKQVSAVGSDATPVDDETDISTCVVGVPMIYVGKWAHGGQECRLYGL